MDRGFSKCLRVCPLTTSKSCRHGAHRVAALRQRLRLDTHCGAVYGRKAGTEDSAASTELRWKPAEAVALAHHTPWSVEEDS